MNKTLEQIWQEWMDCPDDVSFEEFSGMSTQDFFEAMKLGNVDKSFYEIKRLSDD
jgi:hypothetical protein